MIQPEYPEHSPMGPKLRRTAFDQLLIMDHGSTATMKALKMGYWKIAKRLSNDEDELP